jgi:ParB family chromosome partitioning protein
MEVKNYEELDINLLVPFPNHPFSMYEGQRFDDMVASVKASGVLVPLIVRLTAGGHYQILSGHNRHAAAKVAGLTHVPAIVRSGLTDDEAMFIVTETNFIQRSFADMKHSERALVISVHYENIKKQGYRSDLLESVGELTSVPVGQKLEAREKLSTEYALGASTINRYLRINSLTKAFKDFLDDDKISVRAAVALSYLRESEQEIVAEFLANGTKISMAHAEKLAEKSKKAELCRVDIDAILHPKKPAEKKRSIRVREQIILQFFKNGEGADEISFTVEDALKEYFEKYFSK